MGIGNNEKINLKSIAIKRVETNENFRWDFKAASTSTVTI